MEAITIVQWRLQEKGSSVEAITIVQWRLQEKGGSVEAIGKGWHSGCMGCRACCPASFKCYRFFSAQNKQMPALLWRLFVDAECTDCITLSRE